MHRGREIFPQGQGQGPKESFSLNERRSSIKGRLQKERRYCLSAVPEANQSVDSTAPLAKRACEESCGRRSTRPESVREVGSMTRPKIGNPYAALPKAKASPWQQASAKTTVHVHVARSSHIDSPFIVESPHRLRYLRTGRICVLPLRLRALTVLEAGCSAWLGVASR